MTTEHWAIVIIAAVLLIVVGLMVSHEKRHRLSRITDTENYWEDSDLNRDR